MTAPHPGSVLLNQYLKPISMSQNKLANRIGVPPRRINEIILGKRAISADTAVRLGCFFGNAALYWMQLQAEYDIGQARGKIRQRIEPLDAETRDPDTPPAPPRRRIRRRIMR